MSRQRTMKRIVMTFAILGILGSLSTPAGALSCAPPEPIDWSTRLPASQAALIGVIESVDEVDGDSLQMSFFLRVRVIEYLHGRAPAVIEYLAPNHDPWGPYYEVGQEIAVVIEDGEVTDGQMHICGPWFSPEELRDAATDHGSPPPPPASPLDRILELLERFFRLLFGWR